VQLRNVFRLPEEKSQYIREAILEVSHRAVMRLHLEHHVQVTKIQERLVHNGADERVSKLQKEF